MLRRLEPIAAGAALLLLAAALLPGADGGAPGRPAAAQTEPDSAALAAAYAGSAVCLDCHDAIGAFYADSPHHPRYGAMAPDGPVSFCESCHGPGAAHAESGDPELIFGPDELAGVPSDGRARWCLQCHRALEQQWWHSEHGNSGISCAECHVDQAHHARGLKARDEFDLEPEFCLQCHASELADFRLQYNHPVLEGEMGCTDCHRPHGEAQGTIGFESDAWSLDLLGANRPCLRCHAEIAGPFVYEHEAIDTEDCVLCHRPHGSPNDRLLRTEDNSLCQHCHYQPDFPVIGDVDHGSFLAQRARCWDCHAEIHGSHVDEYFLTR